MIRYDGSRKQIETAVNALNATWIARAQARTAAFIANGKFEDASPIWSEVKPVYIRLQFRKCVFCERQFEDEDRGRIEYDLEHFRPKSSVKQWPPPGWPKGYGFATGGPSGQGYFWLAYDLVNYAASCKVCNTVYKSNSFPIGGGRGLTPADDLKQEKQYLCYPIGKSDTDPETLITFIGTTAIPVAKSGHKRRRAEVVIDFFQLNSNDQLHKERARLIALVGGLLVQAAAGIDPVKNRATAERFLAPHIPHVNCLRSFHRLWQNDENLARQYYDTCLTLASEQPP